MAGDPDDKLALEQTAPADRTQTQGPRNKRGSRPAPTKLTTLGRYKIEGELGAGGMGIVYAAFDPDLERRVALKVLLAPDGQDAHKQRLLREARAMARLTHPNVVTVHEVQTVDGRDYVAMELVEGQSLAEWLRASPRSEDDILAAFVAAGRGLAAAHAAGMVHRDFKPHNVLRSTSGRIAVTDFGLAREAHADPLAVTGVASAPVAGTAVGATTPSTPLAGLTMTGSVLGTPAYMAPEQWSGGTVSPATDQFAFCVALWEALAGARPFHGDTLEILKRAVALGPAQLDDSKLPPRLRPILRRGLDPVAARRWPSMDALLAELAPAPASKRGRPWLQVGFAAVGLAGFGVYLATRPADEAAVAPVGCPPTAIEPPSLPADRPVETRALQRDLAVWTTQRAATCELAPAVRDPQLACLDRVRSRLAAISRAISQLPAGTPAVDVRSIDPAICATPPQLEPTSPKLAEALAAQLREEANEGPPDRAAIRALVERVADEPCASAPARLLAYRIDDSPARDRVLADAEQDAARCPDERIRADTALAIASLGLERAAFGIPSTAKLKLAAAAIERVPQRDLTAELEALWMQQAARAEETAEAIAHGEAAAAGFRARGRLDAEIDVAMFLDVLRTYDEGTPDDLAARRANLARLQREAEATLGPRHPSTLKLARRSALELFFAGDAVGAQQALAKLRVERPLRKARTLRARVIDLQGKPVAGATVSAGVLLSGAGTAAAFPTTEGGAAMRSAVTAADGEVAFEVPQEGMVIAQLGDRRSLPADIADQVTLALEPTSRIEGRVELRGVPARRVAIAVGDRRIPPTTRYELVAPVSPDGRFVIEGVPRTKIRLFASIQGAMSRALSSKELEITQPVVTGIAISVADHQTRAVDVIVRSTVEAATPAAQVWLRVGTAKSTTLDKFELASAAAIRFAKPPKDRGPLVTGMKPGDLIAHLEAPAGPASACVLGLPAQLDELDLDRKVRDNLGRLEVRCVAIPPSAASVIVEVPPWPRLD